LPPARSRGKLDDFSDKVFAIGGSSSWATDVATERPKVLTFVGGLAALAD